MSSRAIVQAMHLPLFWRFRLLRAVKASGRAQNRRFLAAWQRAEGGNARYNPLNTTEPWAGATDYNSIGVKNYPSAAAGISATAATLLNGHYPGLLVDLRTASKTAEQIVADRADEIRVWGTNPDTIAAVLHNL